MGFNQKTIYSVKAPVCESHLGSWHNSNRSSKRWGNCLSDLSALKFDLSVLTFNLFALQKLKEVTFTGPNGEEPSMGKKVLGKVLWLTGTGRWNESFPSPLDSASIIVPEAHQFMKKGLHTVLLVNCLLASSGQESVSHWHRWVARTPLFSSWTPLPWTPPAIYSCMP